MSGNRFKKMRQYVREIQPAGVPLVAYADVDEHDKQFTFPPGTHIPISKDITPILIGNMAMNGLAMPVVANVTVRQRVLDRSFRKTYKRLKIDIRRERRDLLPVPWEQRDRMTLNRRTTR